jgi:myo-inositol-1(or 4)-monophosphatase
VIDALIAAVRAVARAELMPRFRRTRARRKDDGSPVTEADTASQAALAVALATIRDVPMLGEEMTEDEQAAAWRDGARGVWIVDPIDGTTNFVQGLPAFAISVAYFEHGRPLAGVVYNPAIDELFAATRGGGAFLNGAPLRLEPRGLALADAVAGIETKYLPPALARAIATEPPFYSQRSWGSGSIEWCYVAAGRFDVYLHAGQKLWDYAAGALVLAEAGGAITSIEREDFWAAAPANASIIAAREPQLLAEWRDWVRARHAPPAT